MPGRWPDQSPVLGNGLNLQGTLCIGLATTTSKDQVEHLSWLNKSVHLLTVLRASGSTADELCYAEYFFRDWILLEVKRNHLQKDTAHSL